MKIKILHLEDMPADSELVARELKKSKLDFEHLVIDSEKDYLIALEVYKPDIILSDHSLPSFNSLEALKILKKKNISVPFILITATMSEETAIEVVKEGADDYILKDRLKRLPYAVINTIDKYKHEQERKQLLDQVQKREQLNNETLKEISSKLLLATKASGVGVWEYIIEQKKVIWDEQMYEIYGLPQNAAICFKSWKDGLHTEDSERMADLLKGIDDNKSYNSEFRIILPDGSIKFIDAHALLQFNEKGNAIRMVGTNQDVTKERIAEQAVKESEAKFRAFFENSLDGIFLSLPDGEILEANAAACELFGMSEDELRSVGRLGLLDTSGTSVEKHIEQRRSNGQAFSEMTFIRKDGSRFPGELSSKNFIDAYGQMRTTIVVRDISARKLAEKSLFEITNDLQHTVNKLNNIMASSMDIICTIDGEGKFVTVSAAAEHIWGYAKDELEGSLFINFVYKEDKDHTLRVAENIINGQPVSMFENRYLKKDGTLVPILWSAKWHKDDQLMYCIAKDATEKKRLEKAYEIERQRFIGLYHQAPSCMGILKGPDHVFELANPLYLDLIGKKDIIGKPAREVLPELVSQGFLDIVDHVYKTGETFSANEFSANLDLYGTGELVDKYLNLMYQANRNEDGEIDGILFFAIDVTEQVLSRKKIEESEKQYKQIVETAQEGIWMLDENNITTFTNEMMAQILGYSREEMHGIHLYSYMNEEWKAMAVEAMKNRSQGEAATMDFKFISKEGKEIWTTISSNPIFEDGVYKGALGMVTDITERKKLELDHQFKVNLLDTIGQSVIATDKNGIVTYWNDAAAQIYGWTKEEALGKNIIHITPTELNIDEASEIMKQLNKGKTWSGEFMVKRKDGSHFPAFVSDSPIYENGKLTGIIGISTDLTEKKKLEKRLAEATKLAKVGNWELDLVNNCLFWSDVTKEIHEVDPEFTPDVETAINFYKSEVAKDALSKAMQDSIENGNSWNLRLQIITAKGAEKWVRVLGDAEMVNGKCIRLYGSIQDIDDVKKAELEVLKAYQEKNQILESIRDGFLAVDKNWTISYWNTKAEFLLNKKKEDVIGQNLWEIYGETINSVTYQKYHRAVKTGEPVHFEDYFPKLSMWFEISAYPLEGGLSVYFKNVTKRKESELELKQLHQDLQKFAKELAISNKELEQFAYGASHDLQEPLRMVTNFLTQIEKKYGKVLDERGKQYIHFAVDGAKRMRQIILDLLQFSRVGRLDEDIEPVDTDEILKEVLYTFKRQVSGSKIIIKNEPFPIIHTYKTLLLLVFQNLISNALKYRQKDIASIVEISYSETNDVWQFEIKDNGIGIEADYLEQIFVVFQRLHNKDEYSGTGMGLSICKRIIENLNGSIWVTSEPGKGSSFFFTIPKQILQTNKEDKSCIIEIDSLN